MRQGRQRWHEDQLTQQTAAASTLILWRAFGGIDVGPRLVATEDVVNLLVLSRDLVLDLGAQP